MGRLKYALIGLLLALPLFAFATVAHAQSFRSGNNVTVPSGQTVNETLFAWGHTIDIAGTVNGDVFCAGQDVTISGSVNGDVICAGQNVEVSGKVDGNVRVAGQDVSVSGPVSGNLTATGQSVTTHTNGTVKGDASVAGQNITMNGSVGRDIAVAANTVILNSSVGRNVTATVEELTLGSSANVTGNVNYTSSNTLSKDNGAVVHGSVSRSSPKPSGHVKPGAVIGFSLAWALYLLIALLLVALVLVLIMPRVYHTTTGYARNHMLKTFLWGLVASIVVPVLLVALLFTVFAIPLAILLGLIYLVISLLAGSFAAYLLGRYLIGSRTHNAIWIMLLGAAVLIVLYFIPFLGAITSAVAFWFGLGTILQGLVSLHRSGYQMAEVRRPTD